MNLLKNKTLVGFVFLLILLVMAIPFLNLPHFWDGIIWTNSAEWMSRNDLNPILPGLIDYGGLDGGHPPFLFFTLATAFFLFGKSLVVSHLIMLFFAFLTAYFTYLLGSYLYNQKVGFISAFLLLFSPLFYAQSYIVNLDLPLAAFTIMSIYFAIKNKVLLYLVIASLLVLTKEPGMFTVIAILIYVFIKNFKTPKINLLGKCLVYACPLLSLTVWVFFHGIYQGQISLGHSSVWQPITFIVLFRLLNRLKVFFFDDFHWIFTLIILISLVSNYKKSLDTKKIILSLMGGITFLILFTSGFKFLLNNTFLLDFLTSLAHNSFYIGKKNLQETLLSFYSYRFIFAISVAIIISFLIKNNNTFLGLFKNRKLIPIYLTFLFYFLLFSWTFYLPRYSLPLYPFFFIFSTNALVNLFKRKLIYIAALVIIGIMVSQWYGHSDDTRGYLLEKNLEYQDSILTHKSMTEYIETNFPDATILTYPFLIDELRYPHLGYVKQSINPLDYSHYNPSTKSTDFTLNMFDWYYYQCYLNNRCDTNNLIPVGEGDIRMYDQRYNEYLTTDDFDLFYYSPQSPYPRSFIKPVNDFNLTLIKRFERNGKYTELYASEKFLHGFKTLP